MTQFVQTQTFVIPPSARETLDYLNRLLEQHRNHLYPDALRDIVAQRDAILTQCQELTAYDPRQSGVIL